MSRPNLFKLDTWGRHENSVLEVFQCALLCLEAESELPEKEDELNRKLLFHARSENYRLINEGQGCHSNIYYECANQPVVEDKDRAGREWKRPDFMCGLVDAQAEADLFFVLECKRLGRPTSPGWILNENYTKHGVSRFVDPDWGYGDGATSGAMIGYGQSMSPDEILKEVNDHAEKINVPAIKRERDGWVNGGLTRLNQNLNRKMTPSPFRLRHLWVDLRHRYPFPPGGGVAANSRSPYGSLS